MYLYIYAIKRQRKLQCMLEPTYINKLLGNISKFINEKLFLCVIMKYTKPDNLRVNTKEPGLVLFIIITKRRKQYMNRCAICCILFMLTSHSAIITNSFHFLLMLCFFSKPCTFATTYLACSFERVVWVRFVWDFLKHANWATHATNLFPFLSLWELCW